MSVGFHAKMSLFSWRNLTSVSSYLGSKACFSSWSSVDVIILSVVSQLSLSQSKACLMSPLMEMMSRGPGIFKTK
jgi:hypothetical protein